MDEVFPILGGVIVGLVVPTVVPVLGVTASWISGELAVSTVYILIDVAQVLGATLATWVLVTAWRRRSARAA